MIPYGKQDISQHDIDAVIDVLRSDFLTQGPQVPKFEKTVSDYCGAKYSVATNSATSALHIACLALGLKHGDLLWTSPNTFVASANCALYSGAKVDFVDIDPETYNMSPVHLEEKLVEAEKIDKLPKIVVPVHFAGQSCDMKKIHALSLKYGFKIIEDASHAIGGEYLNEKIGNCRYSDITVFSFHPVKIITTAEGGLLTSNNINLTEKMMLLRSHGITRDPRKMTHVSDGGWYYEQIDLGFNYRMTELQAALGVSQMGRLDEFVAKRHVLCKRYDDLFKGLPIIKPFQSADSYSALHLYPIQLELDEINKSHNQVFELLRENGIGVNVHYIPVHTQPFYREKGFNTGDFVVSERYYSRAISLPMFYGLSFDQQDEVVEVMRSILS